MPHAEQGYFYIYSRMPSALFDTREQAEAAAELSTNPRWTPVVFYRATCTVGRINIEYLHTWYGDRT